MPKTQALRLQEMMAKHSVLFSCSLSLYPVEVKKSSLRKLRRGDVLLLGCSDLTFCLLKEGRIIAEAILKRGSIGASVEITDLREMPIDQSEHKKYQTIFPLLGRLQSREIKCGQRIDISHLDPAEITLTDGNNTIASGRMVTVAGEIAIMIDVCEEKVKK
jgi:hypothetical protein